MEVLLPELDVQKLLKALLEHYLLSREVVAHLVQAQGQDPVCVALPYWLGFESSDLLLNHDLIGLLV